MFGLRTTRKNDYFESRVEPKPKPCLSQLTHAVETLNGEIAECDKEIKRWQWKKSKVRIQFQRAFQSMKAAI